MDELMNMVFFDGNLLKTAVAIFLLAMMFELVFTVVALLKAGMRSVS